MRCTICNKDVDANQLNTSHYCKRCVSLYNEKHSINKNYSVRDLRIEINKVEQKSIVFNQVNLKSEIILGEKVYFIHNDNIYKGTVIGINIRSSTQSYSKNLVIEVATSNKVSKFTIDHSKAYRSLDLLVSAITIK